MVHQTHPSIAVRLQRLRVPMGFAFGLVYVIFCRPTMAWLVPGLAVALLGLLLRCWAAGHLRKHEKLTISGPYRWTRNPLYLGSFLMGLGFSLAGGRWWLAPLFLVLYLLVYLPVMRAEEGELRRHYGQSADSFIEGVSLFVPLGPPIAGDPGQRFSLERFRLNREYKAVLGFLLLAAFLMVRQAML